MYDHHIFGYDDFGVPDCQKYDKVPKIYLRIQNKLWSEFISDFEILAFVR